LFNKKREKCFGRKGLGIGDQGLVEEESDNLTSNEILSFMILFESIYQPANAG